MALVPATRGQAAALAEQVGEDRLTDAQKACFKKLYRLSDDRTIEDLVVSGEISPVSDDDVQNFLSGLRRYGINTRYTLDHSAAFLRQVSRQDQIALLKAEVPRVLRGYFLKHLMDILEEVIIPESGGCKCGGTCVCDNSVCGLVGTPECHNDGERQ